MPQVSDLPATPLLLWRARMGWAQTTAAAALGVAEKSYQEWERGFWFSTGKPVTYDRRALLAAAAIEHGFCELAARRQQPDLKRWRERLGLTHAAAAEQIGLSKKRYQECESGRDHTLKQAIETICVRTWLATIAVEHGIAEVSLIDVKPVRVQPDVVRGAHQRSIRHILSSARIPQAHAACHRVPLDRSQEGPVNGLSAGRDVVAAEVEAAAQAADLAADVAQDVAFHPVDYLGRVYDRFYACQAPARGPGWFVYGRHGDESCDEVDRVFMCARPAGELVRHRQYTCLVYQGWRTERAATDVMLALNAGERFDDEPIDDENDHSTNRCGLGVAA